MRLRLIFSFILIVLVSVISVVVIARQNTVTEVRAFMFRGGMTGTADLVTTLEDYYRQHGSWQGVDSLFYGPGHASPGGQGRGYGPGGMMGLGLAGMMANQRLRLADPQGNILADSSTSDPTGQLTTEQIQSAVPLIVDRRTVGYLMPEGGFNFTQTDEALLLARLANAALTAGLIGGGVALVLALLLAYGLLKPLNSLNRAAGRLAHGDLSQRVDIRGRDEIARLGATFNQMAASLQSNEEQRQAMTADIAHELRTPLSVQRAHLEALQDGIYPLTPESLQPILDQNQMLTRLVEDLRTLALAEAGQLHLDRQPVELPGLVQRVVERFTPQAAQRQVQLKLHPPPGCPTINLDAGRVEQILGNLLANALRYTPEGGEITLAIACGPTEARLTVRDSGPGIPPEALPHIFDRFYRADRSRSRMEGGTGLGLAIARKFAEAHGGQLSAANDPRGGAVFTLSLPIES